MPPLPTERGRGRRQFQGDLAVHPREPVGQPLLHPPDLLAEGPGDVPVRPDVLTQDAPAVEVPCRRLIEQRRIVLDGPHQPVGREQLAPQAEPAIGVAQPELGVLEQPAPVGVIALADQPVVPAGGAPALEIVRVAEREVVVPGGAHIELAVAVLVHVRAQAKAVDVLGQLDDDVIVDEGADVDEFGVAADRVPELRAVEGRLERVEIVPDPVLLALRQFGAVRVVVDQALPPARGERLIVAVEFVFLDDVPAGNLRVGVVARLDLRDIHAVRADLDFLHEHVHAHVVAHADDRIIRVEEHLDEARARRVAARFIGPLVGQHVAHERLVGVGPLEDPVRFGRETEDRDVPVVAPLVARLEMVLLFRESGRALAPDIDGRGAGEIDRAGEGGPAPRRRVDEEAVCGNRVCAYPSAERIDDGDRQR